MSSATLVVILIVSRGNLDDTSSEVHINKLWITDNRNLLLGNRVDDTFPVKTLNTCMSLTLYSSIFFNDIPTLYLVSSG